MSRDALITLALDHHKAGRLTEADRFYRDLLTTDPSDADALHLSGIVALAQGNPVRSLDCATRALVIRETIPYRLSFAAALVANERQDEAALAFEAAVAAGVDTPETHDSMATLYVALHRWTDAEAACRRAIATHPTPAQAWLNLGIALQNQGRIEEAAEAFAQSLAIRPGDPDGLAGLGNNLRVLGRLEESETALNQVRALRPSEYGPLNNLALTYEALGRYPEALGLMDDARRLAPESPVLRHNRALILMRLGRLAEGWPEFDARMALDPSDETYARYTAIPRWTGDPLDGRTILITHEQGLGDTIQFMRYTALVADRGGRVVLDVQPALHRLAATLPDTPRLAIPGEAHHEPVSLHCPIMSLPGLCGTILETIPAAVPYFAAAPSAVAHWAARIGTEQPGLRIGLVWAGNPHHPGDRQRSIPFAAFAPLLAIPGIRWFSLQAGLRAADAAGLDTITDLSPGLTDFAETAAAMAALDLVIAVDTSSAHLAGALARPVWLLLPFNADSRWLIDRDTTPWYPTMRLFRQDARRIWPPVLDGVARELGRHFLPLPGGESQGKVSPTR